MAFFQAYFDESGKYQTHKVVSFCGFLNSDWAPFEDQWSYLLRKNKISHLHISKGNLKATAEQIKFYQPFVQAILATVELGIAFTVDVEGFKAAHKVVRSEMRDDPHYLVFSTALRDVVKYVKTQSHPTAAIICDDEPSKACECYKSFDVMRQNIQQPDNREVLKSIAFADAKFYLQLQAADLFSWACRAESLYRFFGEQFSLREIWREFNITSDQRKIEYRSGFWSAKYIKELSDNTIADLARKARVKKKR